MDKIHSVGFDVDIIDFLAESLIKEDVAHTADLSWATIVTPGRRPQFYLRKALAGRIKKAFLPPSIFSIEEFIQHLAKKNTQLQASQTSHQPISLIDACFIIYKIIQNLKLPYFDWQKQLEFEHFFLWARKIFRFLEELDKELVSERQLLNLQDNAQIGLPLPDYINQLLENINQIHKEFHRFLEEAQLTTSGFNYYRVAQSIDKICLDEFKKIYFVGFFALNACEKKIIKYLLNKDKAHLLWQRDEDKWSIFEELEEFFTLRPKIIKSEDTTRPRRNTISEKDHPRIQIYEGFDVHSQVEAAREILLSLKDLEDTCIVLPQAGALMPLLYQALPPDIADYNVSLGYPLKRTPIYALVDMIMQSQGRKRQDGSFYAKDYLKIIMHPYIKNIGGEKFKPEATRILVHKIEEALLGIDKKMGLQKKAFIKLEEIEENSLIFQIAARVVCNSGLVQIDPASLRNQLKLIHQKCLRTFDYCLTISDFAQATQELLYFILKKSKVSSDVFSGEVFNRFLAVLDSLGQSLFKEEIFKNQGTFFELLKSSLFLEKIPFTGTPVRGLQILGLLETRNLKFKNLLVLDLNEGVLPKTDKGESLIPEGIFPILDLPHYHKKEQIMRYHFCRLLGSAKNVFLFYQACSRNNQSRSRFIEEIIWQQEKKNRKLYTPDKIKHIEFRVTPTKETFSFKKTPKTLVILKKRAFSPTSIDTYLNCPARFYFRYCLGLKEKEDISEELEASDIGNFLHSLLRDFYSLFLNKTVQLDGDAHSYLFEIKEKKLKEFFDQNTGELFLLSRIIDYKLENLLKQESKRKERIKILCLEEELPIEPEKIKIDTEYGPVCLKGKLDRVDERIFDGRKQIVILDYKTGRYSLPKKNTNKNSLSSRKEIKKTIGSFQLPLYIYLFSEFKKIPPSVIEASFYSLRETKEVFLFGGTDRGDLIEVYLDAARRVLSEILCPDFDFVRDDSDEYYCRWCPFPGLCKR